MEDIGIVVSDYASNVQSNSPATNTGDDVVSAPLYKGKIITQEDRAREAIRLIQAEGKNISTLKYVLNLKTAYGDGVTTLCLIYNATGDVLELTVKKDWLGYVYGQEPPRSFENGQWLAFLHAHPTSEAYGCEAARVYRGKNKEGEVRDFMFAWSTPWGRIENSAYTEVREKDHFLQYWDYVKEQKLEKANKITKDESDQYCASAVSIGGLTSPECIAIFRHKFSPMP
ncbi:hypothetical protein BVRB_8g186900 [Beta vulgaris subsp. vulgaris]|nr:hypothetical protein BVRB_8g186900 [Beta vulgaris subsp. vulgaris]